VGELTRVAKARHDAQAGRETTKAPARTPEARGPAPELSPRRRLLLRLWGLLGLAALAEAVWIVASFVRPRRGLAERDAGLVVAGPLDRFEPGSVSAFPAGKFYLVRLKDGGFLALLRECTHLGCTVPWVAEEARFACPCHASAFDITGQVLSPPAPRPLDLHPVRIENGIVKVDTRQRLRRTAFDPSQVVSS
jgi:cytochrome b6-f complex iron-sulfur subunit